MADTITTGNEPSLGGQEIPVNNSPELSGARPRCKRCDKPMIGIPVKIWGDGGKRVDVGVAWHCKCEPGKVTLNAALPEGEYTVSYEVGA